MSDQYVPSDNDIILDLDGVDAIHGWMPVPSGLSVLPIDGASVVATQMGGRPSEKKDRIVEGPMAGRGLGIDRIFIPNREKQTPEAYATTAGYFKGKIEAITGRPYGGRLNVREMIGLKYKALVLLVDEGYGPQNRIQTYLPLTADTAGIVIPSGPVTPRPRGGDNGGGAAQETAAAGRFKI